MRLKLSKSFILSVIVLILYAILTFCIFLYYTIPVVEITFTGNSHVGRLKRWSEETSSFHDNTGVVQKRWLELIKYSHIPSCNPQSKNFTYYIKSHYAKGRSRRDLIRTGWGKNENLIFIVFNDTTIDPAPTDANSTDFLLIEGFEESLDNFSVKIALGVVHANNCNDTHTVFTDDDVHFWPDRLSALIQRQIAFLSDDEARVYGHRLDNETPVRDKHSPWRKYYMEFHEFPKKYYPDYCNGAGYVATREAISRIAKHVPYTNVIRIVDDVYFGMLASDAKVPVVNLPQFSPATEEFIWRCDLVNLHGYYVNNDFLQMYNSKCNRSMLLKKLPWVHLKHMEKFKLHKFGY